MSETDGGGGDVVEAPLVRDSVSGREGDLLDTKIFGGVNFVTLGVYIVASVVVK